MKCYNWLCTKHVQYNNFTCLIDDMGNCFFENAEIKTQAVKGLSNIQA